ncbi:MAG: alpha-hydroxy acid oxidase [Bryobacteraceae bacterium]
MTRRDCTRQLGAFLAASPILRAQSKLDDMINIFDFDPACKERISKTAYEYVSGGSWDEWTLARNREGFRRIVFRPRFFREVDKLDLSTTILGQKFTMPILVAPTGSHGLIHPEGELATAQGAGAAGAPMVVSTTSSFPIEKIAAAATGPLWFQLYAGPDLEGTRERVEKAVAAGCKAVCLTVDAPYFAPRERDARNRLGRPTADRTARRRAPGSPPPSPYGLAPRFQAELNWSFLADLKAYAKAPVLVKGILTPEDAQLCVERGADGIVVSNHGGRYLDGDPSTIEVLPEIVEVVAGRIPVLIDSGFRRGTDILKALALGAKAVLVGRPPLWGLGAFGETGVRRVMEILSTELAWAMGLAGRPSLASIDRSLVRIELR